MLKTSQEASIDPAHLYALVQSILPEISAGRWAPQSFSIGETRKHHSKMLIFCHLAYIDQSVQALAEADLVIKCYGQKSGGDSSYAALRYLWQAGFAADQPYSVPRLYGYQPEQGFLIQEHAAGTTWSEWLRQTPAAAAQVATQAAGWLVRLQQTPVPPQVPSQCLGEVPYCCLATPGVLLQKLAASFPAYASRLEEIEKHLQPQQSQVQGLPGVLSHGDFHPKNVLFTPERTTVIDFDAYGVHEAAFDVGYCIGQLLSMAYWHSGTIAPGAAAASIFWQRYAQEGSAAWPHVSLATACTLVQVLHYALRVPHAAHVEILAPWLDLIEQWMTCDDARILTRLTASG
jgi:hypothetical protein